MRLSDAIALGRVLIKKPDPSCYCHCAIGMAVASLKGRVVDGDIGDEEPLNLAFKTWPWIAKQRIVPPILHGDGEITDAAEAIISGLFYQVSGKISGDRAISLEQLIDWVRSVEPAESEPAIAESLQSTELVEKTCP